MLPLLNLYFCYLIVSRETVANIIINSIVIYLIIIMTHLIGKDKKNEIKLLNRNIKLSGKDVTFKAFATSSHI